MKKMIALILALLMVLSLAACGAETTPENKPFESMNDQAAQGEYPNDDTEDADENMEADVDDETEEIVDNEETELTYDAPLKNQISYLGVGGAVKVTFTNIPVPENVTVEDMSVLQDGSVLAWAVEDPDLDMAMHMYVTSADGGPLYPSSTCWDLFHGHEQVRYLDLTNLDTSYVVDMRGLFGGFESLETVDVSCLDVSNVRDMSNLFFHCYSLREIDLSAWDTSKVTDMSGMFYDCNSLETLNLTNVKTGAVKNMNSMFFNCCLLTELDVSGFDTANVTDMMMMFRECSALTELDVSRFDTAKVENMCEMFYFCQQLTSLDVSGWDTAKVTDMDMIFHMAPRDNLDLSGWVIPAGANLWED